MTTTPGKPHPANPNAKPGHPKRAPKGALWAKLKCPEDEGGQHCVCFRKHGASCCWCKGVAIGEGLV